MSSESEPESTSDFESEENSLNNELDLNIEKLFLLSANEDAEINEFEKDDEEVTTNSSLFFLIINIAVAM